MSKLRGQFGLLIVAIIWGTGFVVSAVAVDHYEPFQIMALRFSIGAILIMVFFWKQLKNIKKSTLIRGGFLGVVLFLAFLFQTMGLLYTTPSKNAFLTSVNVVIVPILAFVFFKIPVKRNAALGAIFSIIGIGVISLDRVTGFNLGDLLTLICAVFFALQIILTNVFLEEEEPITLTIVQLSVAAILGIISCLINDLPLIENTIDGNLSVFYLGAISTMLAYLIQTVSQRYTGSAEAAIILSTEALFGMLASVIFLGELITLRMLLGALLIFSGIIMTELPIRRRMMTKMENLNDKKETYH